MSQPSVTSQQPPSYGPPAGPPPTAAAPPPSPPPRPRLRDRLFGLRSLLVVGLAGVIIGGGAGAGIMALAGSGSDGQRGPAGHLPARGQFPGGPWVRPGQVGGFGHSGQPGQGASQRTPAF